MAESKAASLSEIESACPGATSDFIIACGKRELSVEQCAAAWHAVKAVASGEQLRRLQEQNDTLRAEVKQLRSEVQYLRNLQRSADAIRPVSQAPIGADFDD